MEITYRQMGDYQLPELTLPEEQPSIGKYGMLRRTFLKNHRRAYYSTLMITGKLMEHLEEIEQAAPSRMAPVTKQMEQQAGVTEELKAENPMMWIGLKNNIRQAAEEQILQEFIYS